MPHQLQLWLPRFLTGTQWLLAAGIAYSIATTALALIGGPAPAAIDDATPSVRRPATTLPPAPTMSELTQRSLFGREQGGSAQRANIGAPAVPTRLPLTLEAVFVGSDPAESGAIISQRGKPGKLYSTGDTVPGNARLEAVETERVLLRRAGSREALAFKVGYQVKAKPAAPKPVISVNSAGPQDRQNHSSALASLGTDLAQRPEETLNELGISPNASGGYRISKQSNPYLLQSGLQPDDIVLSVNGRPVGDLSVDRLAIANLTASESVRVEIMRNGQTLTITSRIPESFRQ